MTDQDNLDYMNDDEFYEYRRNLVKETFTEEDFLSCEKTRERLVAEFCWNWEKNGEPNVEKFYQGIRGEMQGKYATPLFYDVNGEFSSKLNCIIFKHLKRDYDITIFHDCPDLADPLIRQYESIQQAKKDARKFRKNTKITTGNPTNKKFDWATKTYK